MNRLVLYTLMMCLCLAAPIPAGQVEPQGDDFLVFGFDFGAKGTASTMSPNGSFVVAWDAYFCCMAAKGYDEDLNSSSIWDLIPGFPATRDPIDVTTLADDDFVVTWETYNKAFEPVIQARRFALSGTPLGPSIEVVGSADGTTNLHPAVDAWPIFSSFLVAWTQDDPADPGADALDIQLAAFGTSKAPEGHFMVNTYVTGDQDYPELSVGPDSSFVVVWRSAGSPGDDSDGRSVQGTWFSPGGTPGTQFQVNSHSTGDQDNVDVAMAPDGSFLVVWDGESAGPDPDLSIQGRLFGPDQVPVGPDFQINTYTTAVQSEPAVASDEDGSFLVVWRSATGVFGQEVGPTGALLGPEVTLNSTVSNDYSEPTVAGALNGRFVVTWDSDDDYQYGSYDFNRRARQFSNSLFADGFESGDTAAWNVTVP